MRDFHPHWLTAGGHRQTLLGVMRRRPLRWTPPTEDLAVDVGDGVRLLLRASWQPGPREARPALVLVHGIGGSDASAYGLATGRYAWERGWHVVRMNLRGAGESLRWCASLSHAGQASDLVAALGAVAARAPRLAVAGFSIGGSLALLALGRRSADLPPGLFAGAAVSPPIDSGPRWRLPCRARRTALPVLVRPPAARQLPPSATAASRPLRGRPRARRAHGLAVRRPHHCAHSGYRDAAEYYASSSPGPSLHRIERPVLILAAQDDPIVPVASLTAWPLPRTGVVQRELLPTGGHVGFFGRTRAPGRFWAAERVVRFLEAASRD
jgi:predicted alpha/beta-fold hydrolase